MSPRREWIRSRTISPVGLVKDATPTPSFDTVFYLRSNPDVAAASLNPLVHFVLHGRREGRLPHARSTVNPAARFYVPPHGLLPWFNPLNVEVSAGLSPRLNVLLPSLGDAQSLGRA